MPGCRSCEYTNLGQEIVGKEIGVVDETSRPHFSTFLFDGDVTSLEWRRYNFWFLGFHPGCASFTLLQNGQLELIGSGAEKKTYSALKLLAIAAELSQGLDESA